MPRALRPRCRPSAARRDPWVWKWRGRFKRREVDTIMIPEIYKKDTQKSSFSKIFLMYYFWFVLFYLLANEPLFGLLYGIPFALLFGGIYWFLSKYFTRIGKWLMIFFGLFVSTLGLFGFLIMFGLSGSAVPFDPIPLFALNWFFVAICIFLNSMSSTSSPPKFFFWLAVFVGMLGLPFLGHYLLFLIS